MSDAAQPGETNPQRPERKLAFGYEYQGEQKDYSSAWPSKTLLSHSVSFVPCAKPAWGRRSAHRRKLSRRAETPPNIRTAIVCSHNQWPGQLRPALRR